MIDDILVVDSDEEMVWAITAEILRGFQTGMWERKDWQAYWKLHES